MITLEKHLNQCKDSKAKDLAAAWTLNKTRLSSVLSLITTAFPTYSLHDASHSETIIENIERLLGDNIKKLGATDTFMLLMAAYTHDLGMYLSYKIIEDKWKTNEFAKKINELEKHRDPQIAKAAKLLRETQEKVNTPAAPDNNMLWALEVKNAVTLLTVELFRGEHAIRSANYINDDKDFAKLLVGINQYAGLRSTLAKIAYLHYEDFNKIFILEKEADGYSGSGDKCHPRFVACMIRMGDLLDFDKNRFNDFALAMVKEVPETSLVHYRKHCSTGGEMSNVSPTEIKVTFDCKKNDVFREAVKWKKMVEQEIYNMHAYWFEIVPRELSSNFRLPSAKQINIKLKYHGNENPNPDLMNLRFDISSKKTFEMLKGGAIYRNPGRVFLREIVENAIDATKLQIWKDLKNYLPLKLQNPDREIKAKEDIKFSDDIPSCVYDKYPISLKVNYFDEEKVIRVVCEDWGTGISEESLIRMTSQVGESRKADKEYENTIKDMPYFLKPTAAFGLGLQTVFYVADEFTIETKYSDEPGRRIVFRSSTDGSYCDITDENISMHRGTKVLIDINENHLRDLFELEHENAKEIFDNKEILEYYIPNKIDQYIQTTFEKTENIPLSYQSKFWNYKTMRTNSEFKHIKDEGDFRVSYKRRNNIIIFRIEEKRFGSIMELWYRSLLDPEAEPMERLFFRDRAIYRHLSYNGARHIDMSWNIFNREADTMATISRDTLLPQGKAWCTETINQLMPDIIRLTKKPLLDELEKSKNIDKKYHNFIQKQYCSLCLADWGLPNPIINDFEPLRGLKLPIDWASNVDFEPIYATELLCANEIIVVRKGKFIVNFEWMKKLKRSFQQAMSTMSYAIFCWNKLEESIPNNFVCRKVISVPWLDSALGYDHELGYCLVKKTDSSPKMVESSTVLIGLNYNSMYSRSLLPGFDDYESIVVNNAPLLGEDTPYHCNCWIYYPKLDINLFDLRWKSRVEAKQLLEKMSLPDYIVKLIQKHNILKNENLTEKEIINTYIRLILGKYGVDKTSEGKE